MFMLCTLMSLSQEKLFQFSRGELIGKVENPPLFTCQSSLKCTSTPRFGGQCPSVTDQHVLRQKLEKDEDQKADRRNLYSYLLAPTTPNSSV